eukprot:g2431.t1
MRKELEASSANNAEEAERTRPDEEAKWKAEEERARQEQEAKQKAAAERARLLELAKRNEEAERVRREEEAKQKAEQERLGREKEAKKAEEERLRREEEAKKAEEERIRQVEKAKKAEEERVRREEEAKKAEEERVLREEEEAKKAEEERVRREAEAKEKAEQERLRREEEAKKAEEERVRREEEAKKAEEEHVRREAEAKEKAEQERLRREEEAKKAEEERVRRDEKAKKAEEERVRREQEAKKAEEERARQEAEHKRKEEEERVRRAEEAKNKAEEERARLLAPHNQRPSVTEALLEEAVQKTACAAGLFLTKEEESARLVDLADLERRLSEEGVIDHEGNRMRGFFDAGSWVEYLEGWGRTVITGRARLGGIPMGVIAVETRSVDRLVPADPSNPESCEVKESMGGKVWFPDSAFKTAQALKDFNRGENLPVIIFANWRGFSGGTRDMYNEILKFGAMIVDALVEYKHPIFIYIPKHGELRGGAWVVIDPAINPEKMEMPLGPIARVRGGPAYADLEARGGILEPPGIVEVKYRAPQQVEAMHRIDEKLKQLESSAGAQGAEKQGLEAEIKAREKQLPGEPKPPAKSVAPTTVGASEGSGGLRSRRRNSSMCETAQSDDSYEGDRRSSRNVPSKREVVIRMDARDPSRVGLPKRSRIAPACRREEEIQIWYIFDRLLALLASVWHLRFALYGRPARWGAAVVYEIKEFVLMIYDVLVASRPAPDMQNRLKRTLGLTLKVVRQSGNSLCSRLPLYTSVATTFADLHDRAGRMKAKGVIRDSISWKNSRRYFYWRVKRRVLQDPVYVDLTLSHKDSEALINKWAADANVDIQSDMKMVAWLESQNVEARAESIRTSFLKTHIKELDKCAECEKSSSSSFRLRSEAASSRASRENERRKHAGDLDGDGLTLAAPTLIDEEPQEPLVDESVAMVNSGASDVEVVEGDNPDTGLVVGDTKSAEVVEKQVSEMGHTVANAGGDLVEESKSKTADSERKD